MSASNDRPGRVDEIDIDRAVIDPDYRRRILARLRQDRLRAEAALSASAPPSGEATHAAND